MKPIKLEIEGLNSFEGKQTLDFNQLGTGVFGIFGKTGSGKSTILDAIILAFYGDIERTKQNIEFVNTKRNKTIVSLEFEIFEAGQSKTYLVTRTFNIKRNNKDIDSNAQLFEIIDNCKKLIAEGVIKTNEKILSIIKLGKNEFVKCIALPQGEFAQFLKSKPSERTEIMSKLFNLTKYGEQLCNSVKEKVNEYDKQIYAVSSNLLMVEYANDEKLDEIKNTFSKNNEEYTSKSKILKEKSEKYSKLSKLLEKKNKLKKLNEQYNDLIIQKDKMNNLEIEINKNQNANLIQSDYQKLQKDEINKKDLTEKISLINENRLKSQSDHLDALNDFNNFKKDYDEKLIQLNTKLTKINDLFKFEDEQKHLLKEQSKIKSLIEANGQKLINEEKKLNETNEKLEKIKLDIASIDEFIENNKPDVDLTNALEQTKNIESELILIDEFYKSIEKFYDNSNYELKLAQEEYNGFISQEKKLLDKINKIQETIESAFEFESVDKTNFNKIRSCDKQIDLMKNIKIKVEFIENQISKLNFDIEKRQGVIDSLNEQIIVEQNKLTDIEKKIDETESQLSQKRDEREELLGENFFSLVSNQLKIGDDCPVCNNKIIQKNYSDTFDLKPITNDILLCDTNLREIKFQRDKIFTNLITLKTRCKFEKAQIDINKEEIEKIATDKIVLYKEFVTSQNKPQETFEKLFSLLSSTTESLENLINLQDSIRDELLTISINKAQAGTKVSIYNANLESFINILYSLQKKKAERQFAVYNVNEKFKNLKEFKKQIAEGKNIEIIIDSKKEEKYKLKDEQNKFIILKSSLEKNISRINSETAILNEKLNLSEKQSNRIKENITKNGIPEGISVLNEKKNILSKINELKDDYSKKEYRLEVCKDLLSKTENNYNINLSILNEKKKEIELLESKISNMMIKNNFKNNDELESCFESSQKLKSKQSTLDNYRTNIKLIQIQKEELEKESYNEVDEESVNNIKIEIENLSESVKELSESVGKNSAEYEKIEKDNIKRNELLSELKNIKHNFDLAKELSSVLKGKALAEYVAEEFLLDITEIANQKLNLLLDGKYLLKFINKEFVVEDNFNDGVIRNANTLSGGETFLVSLSLALAISDSISMLSSINMDFFFLDEGFGTLDSELCEVVVSALHKLENQNLKIGLISHVNELEESIKNKIIVTKTSSGSKINIQHSL